jgi:arylsulfatase A-like enzyme
VNGRTAEVEGYATTVAVDDALQWLDGRGDEPWFLWMAFVAPHAPFHLPPDSLHGIEGLSGEADDIATHPEDYYFAAAEALDTEMGRLLRAIEDDHGPTLIVFLGDNGTPNPVLPAGTPRRTGKGSLYAGGIHVPLVLAGAGVEPVARVPHPVNLVDLFPTLLEAAGLVPEALLEGRAVTDGVRLTPYLTDAAATAQRAWIYSELFGPNVADAEVGRTIRGPRFKRTSYADGREEMFDRLDDARERVNLLEAELDPEAETARAALDLVLDSLTEAR